MSRIRTTLDNVTKAVGSTDLISKFSRRKPGSVAAVDGPHAEKVPVKAETSATDDTAAASPSETTMKEEEGERSSAGEDSDKQRQQVPENYAKKSTSSLAAAANASATGASSTVAKQPPQLFHPAALTNNMDDAYKTLSQHINSYFGTSTQEEGRDNKPPPQQQEHRKGGDPVSKPTLSAVTQTIRDHIPMMSSVAEAKSIDAPTTSPPSPSPTEELSSPAGMHDSKIPATQSAAESLPVPVPSSKKGFTHYLSYPRPSVQAFVGSYFAPLVPKFRSDSKSIAAKRDKSSAVAVEEPTVDKAVQKKDGEEEKADEAKKQLLTQREKIIARVSVDNRTRALVKGLQRVTDVKLLTSRVEELSGHLLEFPETRGVAIMERVLPCLLRLRQARDLPLQAAVREALALVGYAEPVKGRGIRVLAIDGGGTRLSRHTYSTLRYILKYKVSYVCDGGLLINNPTALAIHECKCLWPNTPLQCVLSLGTGRYETTGNSSTAYTSLKTKLSHVISSATDTEEVHTMLDALLPPDTYFRFNPYLSEDIPLNESRPEKLNFLKGEGERYLARNEAKLRMAASVLGQEKSAIQRLAEWAKLKANMYEGLPFVSKL
ncbi:Calcium-independent phospholipase A2-gamma [Liparis tanakae]|uniref:Calcium-independent phospholipase A2-gamma n=1 Tax=Liparis tanakae TaxID=230148 RepID=A0A4Z2I6K9_9TELE|nr:Calcium-independent phospholipase A2-gamma [Liparis tanakae]